MKAWSVVSAGNVARSTYLAVDFSDAIDLRLDTRSGRGRGGQLHDIDIGGSRGMCRSVDGTDRDFSIDADLRRGKGVRYSVEGGNRKTHIRPDDFTVVLCADLNSILVLAGLVILLRFAADSDLLSRLAEIVVIVVVVIVVVSTSGSPVISLRLDADSLGASVDAAFVVPATLCQLLLKFTDAVESLLELDSVALSAMLSVIAFEILAASPMLVVVVILAFGDANLVIRECQTAIVVVLAGTVETLVTTTIADL